MRRFAIKSCTWSVSYPVLLSKMGAMRHQKLVGIEVEPLYCKVYDPLPHGTSRLSRFRFGQSVPIPSLRGEGGGGFFWAVLFKFDEKATAAGKDDGHAVQVAPLPYYDERFFSVGAGAGQAIPGRRQ